MAPTIEIAVIAATWVEASFQKRFRKVGNMSCVPCEAKFITAINSVR